jgi:glucosylceramidase
VKLERVAGDAQIARVPESVKIMSCRKPIRAAAALSCLLICGGGHTHAQTVSVWLTTHNLSKKMEPQPSVAFAVGGGGSNPVLVDETQTYQEIEGFGASFTDSAA